MKKSFPLSKSKLFLLLGVLCLLLLTAAKQPFADNNSGSQPKLKHSTSDPTSLWAVVNKGRQLPSTYAPTDLVSPNITHRLDNINQEMQVRSEAAAALERLFKDASGQGVQLMLASAYRSYEQQSGLYNFYVENDGKQKADAYSARPGHSEHQTGLAADIEPANRLCELQECFADTPEGQWLASNAHKYGFIIRYEKGKKSLTGYEYEPWHIRYLGPELSRTLEGSGLTLEQHFKMPTYSDYSKNIYVLKA